MVAPSACWRPAPAAAGGRGSPPGHRQGHSAGRPPCAAPPGLRPAPHTPSQLPCPGQRRTLARPCRGQPRPAGGATPPAPDPPPARALSATEANVMALEAIMDWNMGTSGRLRGVAPVALTPELAAGLRGDAAAAASGPGAGTGPDAPGVLCPWLPNTAAVEELLAQGFQVVGIECGGAAVERACGRLGLGAGETGAHDGWVRHRRGPQPPPGERAPGLGGDVPSGSMWLYRGNPYNLTPPVLSLVDCPVAGVWDAWGLLATPPPLLPRYADVWAQLLPAGGVWLAAALHARTPDGGAPGGAAEAPPAPVPALQRLGLHAHPAAGLQSVLRRAGFGVQALATWPVAPAEGGRPGADTDADNVVQADASGSAGGAGGRDARGHDRAGPAGGAGVGDAQAAGLLAFLSDAAGGEEAGLCVSVLAMTRQ